MNTNPQEGGNRPLYRSAPNLPMQPATEPVEKPYLWAALASYPLAYLYTKKVLFAGTFATWGMPAFAVLFVLGVGWLARSLHRAPARETFLWAGCYLALSVVMPLWGYQAGGLGNWQMLVWHLFAIWYVLARCNVLAAGYSGSLFFLDGVAGCFLLPWTNFLRRIRAVWRLFAGFLCRRSGGVRRLLVGMGSALLAIGLCAFAWRQLSAADANFAALGADLRRWWDNLWSGSGLASELIYFLLSLPVGAWLYGLTAGSLRRLQPPCTAEQFFARLTPLRKLPALTVDLTLGALCGLYALFFAVQAAAFTAADVVGLSAPDAAAFAVDGFWELCRILLLNFGVMAAVHFLAPQPPPRWLAALFAAFGVAFALLDGAKLLAYIHLYGYTPRRVVSGWFLCVLLVWTVLALVRLFASLPAARIAIAVLAVSFTMLSCVNINRQIIRANIGRYAAGVDAELDISVLNECGMSPWSRSMFGEAEPPLADYTQWLVEAGWFDDRPLSEISALYLYSAGNAGRADGALTVILDERHKLVLALQNNRCTAARVEAYGEP